MPQFHHQQLSNGLTIIGETDAAAHTGAVGFFVKTGARDEERLLMGVSHFLEHMMFKGTDRRTADDVNREFDEIGADYNAFTSHETTAYYAHVLPEFLPRATDLLTDMLRPALRTSDFDMEKNVILEEIGMYDDRPQDRLSDVLLERYFGEHPMGHRVLGTKESVGAMTAAQMRGYFGRRYSPDNIVVSATGQVDFEWLCDELAEKTASWEPTGAARVYESAGPTEASETIHDPRAARHYLGLLCAAPSAQDEDRYAAKVLADLLGDSDGSRLYWALVDPGLADAADFAFMPQDRLGVSMGFASCDPERAEQVEKVLLETIDGVGEGLTADEVERAQNKLATLATLQGERPQGRMTALGATWLYLGEYLPLEEELRRLQAVTVADVRRVLEKWPMHPRRLLRMTPGEG